MNAIQDIQCVATAKGGLARLARLHCDIMSRKLFELRLGVGADT